MAVAARFPPNYKDSHLNKFPLAGYPIGNWDYTPMKKEKKEEEERSNDSVFVYIQVHGTSIMCSVNSP